MCVILYKKYVKKKTFIDIMTKHKYNNITKWSYQFTQIGRVRVLLNSRFAILLFYPEYW